jgi:hypothetical protein
MQAMPLLVLAWNSIYQALDGDWCRQRTFPL